MKNVNSDMRLYCGHAETISSMRDVESFIVKSRILRYTVSGHLTRESIEMMESAEEKEGVYTIIKKAFGNEIFGINPALPTSFMREIAKVSHFVQKGESEK